MRVTFYVPTGKLNADTVQGALSLAMEEPPAVEVIEKWTRLEKLIAYDWAIREHLRAADNPAIVRRDKPSFLSAQLQERMRVVQFLRKFGYTGEQSGMDIENGRHWEPGV